MHASKVLDAKSEVANRPFLRQCRPRPCERRSAPRHAQLLLLRRLFAGLSCTLIRACPSGEDQGQGRGQGAQLVRPIPRVPPRGARAWGGQIPHQPPSSLPQMPPAPRLGGTLHPCIRRCTIRTCAERERERVCVCACLFLDVWYEYTLCVCACVD